MQTFNIKALISRFINNQTQQVYINYDVYNLKGKNIALFQLNVTHIQNSTCY